MNWTKIEHEYGPDDEMVYWYSGVYKIARWKPGIYCAYFLRDWANNWGDYVPNAPLEKHYGPVSSKYWPTLEAAQAGCEAHNHKPSKRAIKRAAAIVAKILDKQKENA